MNRITLSFSNHTSTRLPRQVEPPPNVRAVSDTLPLNFCSALRNVVRNSASFPLYSFDWVKSSFAVLTVDTQFLVTNFCMSAAVAAWVPAGIVPLSGGTGWGLCQSSMMSWGAAVMLVATLSLDLSTPTAGIGASTPMVTAAMPAAKIFVFIGFSLRSFVLPIGRIPNCRTIGFNN